MAKISDEELEKLKETDRKLRARYKKHNQYLSEKYDRLNFTVPAGMKAEIETAARASGVSLNAFCRDAVLKAAGLEEQAPQEEHPDLSDVPFMN
jgi:predicted HicB family RNase H-like nuclease